MPETREGRYLLSIVILLFGIQVTLIGLGVVGLVIRFVALLVASITPRSRPGS